ncbi:hypothetical protein AMK68_02955 [candidate division KD3-62 bacterium DG_56]|uniref:Uncharacterized protein n=1 Tax=candidate division KD3-62 bacterium DG_56 TaxID=1704032 RepID=A0A0S7XN12_9BACT|nr:MAG: hypothetical protein AMK68_02955 [candidate division KD3-62 bacterium DG_56]
MADGDKDSETPGERLGCGGEHTLVLDVQWPYFKRTLSKERGGLGAGIPSSRQGSRGRKSPRLSSQTR